MNTPLSSTGRTVILGRRLPSALPVAVPEPLWTVGALCLTRQVRGGFAAPKDMTAGGSS